MIRNVIGAGSNIARFPFTSIGIIDGTAADADLALTITERTFQTIKGLDNDVYYIVPASITNLIARFILTTDNADVDIDILIGTLKKDPDKDADIDCDLRLIGTYDVIAGTQVLAADSTKKYADTATESVDLSITGLTTKTVAEGIAVVHIPVEGFNVIVFHGYGTFNEDCEIELAGYA